jgi:hypothetical protein
MVSLRKKVLVDLSLQSRMIGFGRAAKEDGVFDNVKRRAKVVRLDGELASEL